MPEQKETRIFVFHYKPNVIMAKATEYIHIWAGKNGAKEYPGFTGDDLGDNISDKNAYYSELTGLYWVWKNTDADIVGSCHYRRYFTTSKFPLSYKLKQLLYYPTGLLRKRRGLIYTLNLKYWESKIISGDTVKEILNSVDAILPVEKKFKYSVEEHYRRYHNINDLVLVEKILTKRYPDYLKAYKKVMSGNTMFANNMFIFKWNKFDKLMQWLFSILFEFEKEISLDNYSGYQERIFGFLSERLITVWIAHNNINYKELSLIYFKKLKSNLDA
jgi:hypothetical protein